MAMDWLKGLVGQPAQFIPAGQPVPGGVPGAVPTWTQQPGAPAPATAAWGGAPAPAAAPSANDSRIAGLELRCSELRRDLESLALFSRTLLTLLEEKQIATRDQFQEMRTKIDLIDGRLDDRVDPAAAVQPPPAVAPPATGDGPGPQGRAT